MLFEDIHIVKDTYINFLDNNNTIIDKFSTIQIEQLPIIKDDTVLGILDIYNLIKNRNSNILGIMNESITCVKPYDKLNNYLSINQKIIPVTNDHNKYVGFVRKIDILNSHYNDIKEEYKTIFEFSYDGIQIIDNTLTVLAINSASEKMEGISQKDIVGKNVNELVDIGVYSDAVSPKVLESGKTKTILAKGKNGKELILTGTPIYKDGQIKKVLINARDITVLNNIKRDLVESQKLSKKYKLELDLLRQKQMQLDNVVINNSEMRKIINMISHVALVDSTVLLQGESGVGKGVFSKLIHQNSNRKKGPFIKIDCGAIPETLLESELFGYEKGAFTSANKEGKIGLIELANKGTLFLDEIGELPVNLQVKLLRVIQEREILRIGGSIPISVDIRIIAATNKNLEKMISENMFREDLYYRLNVVPINIPPLRKRKDEIPFLVSNIMNKCNKKYGFHKMLNSDVLEYITNYNWPGNIRELENIVERLVVTTNNTNINIQSLPEKIIKYNHNQDSLLNFDESLDYKNLMNGCERKLLTEAMKKSKDIKGMASLLKIDESTVRKKLKKHNIQKIF